MRYFDGDEDEDGYEIDGVGFEEPGGESALRRATPQNPRNLACPTCGEPDRLTPLDASASYQCNACAERDEGAPMPLWGAE